MQQLAALKNNSTTEYKSQIVFKGSIHKLHLSKGLISNKNQNKIRTVFLAPSHAWATIITANSSQNNCNFNVFFWKCDEDRCTSLNSKEKSGNCLISLDY